MINKKLFLAAISLLLIQTAWSKEPPSKCITNFGQPYCSQSMRSMPAVIIKTSLSKNELSRRLNREIKQIAFLHQAGLYLLESNSPFEEAKYLSAKPDIIYAQPDIIQTKVINDFNPTLKQLAPDIQQLWQKTKGKGIKIAIIDDGFNLEHPDFQGVDIAFQYDADSRNLIAEPKQEIDRHGTPVAGIIFAQHNDFGIDGIAPEASLIAIRQPGNRTSDTVIAFTVAAKAGADIINCSWNSPQLMEPVFDTVQSLAEFGRQGKGTAVVFAAGNNGRLIEPYSIEAAIPEAITVGATEKYSNHGPLVDLYLSGGLTTTSAQGEYRKFGGTSALAPVISGMMALKMALQPELSTTELLKQLKQKLHESN